jgi:hypothetical protein
MMYHTRKWLLCPVQTWASIVQSIKDLPAGASTNTPVCSLFKATTNPTPENPGKFVEVTGKEMTILVQKAIADMGIKCLGFTTPKECGTYLIQSTAAVPMAGFTTSCWATAGV